MGEYKQPPDRAGLEQLSTDELKELIRARSLSLTRDSRFWLAQTLMCSSSDTSVWLALSNTIRFSRWNSFSVSRRFAPLGGASDGSPGP